MKNLVTLILCLVGLQALGQSASLQTQGGSLLVQNGLVARQNTEPAPPVYDTVPTNGLLLHFTLNGTSKEEVTGSNGTWTGSSAFTSDVPSRLSSGFGYTNSALFGGTQGITDYRVGLMTGKRAATIAFWVKARTGVYYDYCIWAAYPTVGWHDQDFRCLFNYTDGYVTLNPATNPGEEVWRHVAVTVTNGVPVKQYLDGSFSAQGSDTASGTMVDWGYGTMIGSRTDGESGLSGQMAQVLIYDRVLTTNEIYHLATGN